MKEKKACWYGSKQLWIMIYTAILFLIGSCVIGGNNNTVFPAFAEARGWNLDIINMVSGIGCIMKAVGLLVLASTVRKLGEKKLIVTTLFISAALLVVFGTTRNQAIFLVVILVLGFLGGGYEKNGGMSITAKWWPTKKGVVLGFTTMGIICMNFLYVPLMPKLFATTSLETGMIIIAIILAVVAVLGLLFVKNTPEEAGTYPDGDPDFAKHGAEIAREMQEYKSPFTLKKVCADRNTWLIGIGSAFAFLAVMTYIASAIPVMVGYGYNYTAATMIFAVGGVMGLVGSVVLGIVDQAIGTRKTFIIYFIFIIIGFVFAYLMPHGLVFCWLAGIVIFAAQGALCNLLPSYVTTKYGRWDYSAGYKVIGTIFEIGAGIGVMATGIFKNPEQMFIFDLIILAAGLVMMIVSNDKLIGRPD